MTEVTTAPAADEPVVDPSTDNIPAADGGETTTPEEVAELLNLPTPEKEEEKDKEEEDVDDDSSDDDSSDDSDDDSEDDETEDETADEDKPKDPVKPEDDAETPDFSLEVTDANGDKFTLKPDDNLEEVLKDFEPKNNGQIFQILKDLGKLETEKAQYESDQETKAQEEAAQERVTNIQAGWDKEIEALQGQKRIPVDAKGKDNERVQEVFKYINEENNKRLEDGRPLLESFEDALDKLELKETKEEAIKKDKEEKELAKKRGGIVGGSSAPASGGAPTYKGGARNANEAIKSMGLL